jgi:hypothetical protein
MLLYFWVLAPCRHVGSYQRFAETFCFHLQVSARYDVTTKVSIINLTAVKTSALRRFRLFYFIIGAGSRICNSSFMCACWQYLIVNRTLSSSLPVSALERSQLRISDQKPVFSIEDFRYIPSPLQAAIVPQTGLRRRAICQIFPQSSEIFL